MSPETIIMKASQIVPGDIIFRRKVLACYSSPEPETYSVVFFLGGREKTKSLPRDTLVLVKRGGLEVLK